MTTQNFTQTSDAENTLNAVDCMTQRQLKIMARLAQEAINGTRKSKSVLATLRNMAQALQNDINDMAETAGCNHTTA